MIAIILLILFVALISFFCGSMVMLNYLSDTDSGTVDLAKLCQRQAERLKKKDV